MSRTVKQYEEEILKVIENNNIFFIEEIFAFTSVIGRTQFYNLKLNESDILLKRMNDNKTKTKKSMQNKWYKSDNATLQIALMKLICEDEERIKLTQNYTEISGNKDKPLYVDNPRVLRTLLLTAQEVENVERLNGSDDNSDNEPKTTLPAKLNQ
jgi:hypothetical protein